MRVLVVIDMQRDFIDGALGTAEAAGIVDAVENRIEASDGELILFTQDTHQHDYLDTPEGKKLPVVHCVQGTTGWEIDQKILTAWRNHTNTIRLPHLADNCFTKPVFGSVELVQFLQEHSPNIMGIELLGVCTDICVISNALMIKNTLPHIPISVNAACCAGVTPESHQAALTVMQMCQVDIV